MKSLISVISLLTHILTAILAFYLGSYLQYHKDLDDIYNNCSISTAASPLFPSGRMVAICDMSVTEYKIISKRK